MDNTRIRSLKVLKSLLEAEMAELRLDRVRSDPPLLLTRESFRLTKTGVYISRDRYIYHAKYYSSEVGIAAGEQMKIKIKGKKGKMGKGKRRKFHLKRP